MKFIVIGLGIFGKSVAIRLTEMGHEVIGVDKGKLKVDELKDQITHTVCMNSTDRDAVSSLPLKDANAVIVAIGEDEAASLLTTALLKQLNVRRIIGRVVSDLQRTVLDAMSIKEYVLPEEESAERLAMRLDLEDVLDSFKITEKYSIVEALVPKRYIGKSIGKADFINAYNVLVLSLIKKNTPEGLLNVSREASGIATANTVMEEGDIVVFFGELMNIRSLLKD